MTILDQNINDINRLCSVYKVRQLFAFGSVLTENFSDNSDIDFVVDFQPIDLFSYTDNYYDLKFSLQDLLKRPVDLLEEKATKNPYLKQSLHQQRKLIYAD